MNNINRNSKNLLEPLSPGAAQNELLGNVTDTLVDKGFVVANLDGLVNWARTGSLWPMTFGLACLCQSL